MAVDLPDEAKWICCISWVDFLRNFHIIQGRGIITRNGNQKNIIGLWKRMVSTFWLNFVPFESNGQTLWAAFEDLELHSRLENLQKV